jgi:uncharacterized protein (DUF1786 family)
MQILAVDVGTGTQDILLFDSTRDPENFLKLVMPSPTLLAAQQIQRATQARQPLLLSGVTMGGGPSAWATEAHHRAGLPIWATAAAARSFNDDLDAVRRDLGITIVAAEEATRLVANDSVAQVTLKDFDYTALQQAFAAFGVDLQPDAVGVAVFDHGNAPPDVSDRQFRLDYLAERLQHSLNLSTFAFHAGEVPAIMTRLLAVVESAPADLTVPLVVMDTAPAAVLGALEDPVVRAMDDALIVNVGNFHCLAFQYRQGQLVRLFEHHTGLLDQPGLERWLVALAEGSISHQQVFAEHGHGALVLDAEPVPVTRIAVTGPRRAMLKSSSLPIYFAVPHGDQMLAGCFGLVRACADLFPAWQATISQALDAGQGSSLW